MTLKRLKLILLAISLVCPLVLFGAVLGAWDMAVEGYYSFIEEWR